MNAPKKPSKPQLSGWVVKVDRRGSFVVDVSALVKSGVMSRQFEAARSLHKKSTSKSSTLLKRRAVKEIV